MLDPRKSRIGSKLLVLHVHASPIRRNAFIWVILSTLPACASDKVPEILRGVSAGGGYWGACPSPQWAPKQDELAISPEFNDRLATRYPPGSAEIRLLEDLTREGFKDSGHCESEPAIRIMAFHADGIGLLVSAITAQAYWQSDAQGRIVWTKGFVAYTGL